MAKFQPDFYNGDKQEDLQRYFDKTVRHLYSGKGRCVGKTGKCIYGNGKGNYCAVGVHTPPGKHRRFAGTVADLLNGYPELIGIAAPTGKVGEDLANHLQYAHDSIENWKGRKFIGRLDLEYIARRCELSSAVLQEYA